MVGILGSRAGTRGVGAMGVGLVDCKVEGNEWMMASMTWNLVDSASFKINDLKLRA